MPPVGWKHPPESRARLREAWQRRRSRIPTFWERVDKSGECWLWTGVRTSRGYGEYRLDNVNHAAHRFAWQLMHGLIPAGFFVCHSCDNPPCVRPDHLFLGTPKDNMQDMVRKGRTRARRGSTNRLAKITEVDVEAIRDMHHRGATVAELARGFGVSGAAIRHIVYSRTWRHVA